jgi:hypothetical protein
LPDLERLTRKERDVVSPGLGVSPERVYNL